VILRAFASDALLFAVSTARGLLVVPWLLGWLGNEGYGLWALLGSWAGLLTVAQFSVAGSLVRRQAAQLGQSAGVVTNEYRAIAASGRVLLIALASLMAVAGVVLVAALPWLLPELPADITMNAARLTLALLAMRYALGVGMSTWSCLLMAHGRQANMYAVQTMTALLSLAGLFLVTRSESASMPVAALVGLVAFLPEPIWCWWRWRALTRERIPWRSARRDVMRELLATGGWLGVASLAGVMQTRCMPVLISWTLGLPFVALYDANARLWQAGLLLARKIPNAAWPIVTQRLSAATDAAERLLWIRLGLVPGVWVSAAGCGAWVVVAGQVMELWVGAGYWPGYAAILPLALLTVVQATHHGVHLLLLSLGAVRRDALATLVEVPLAMLLAWAMLPRFGLAGAWWAMLIAHLSTTAWAALAILARATQQSAARLLIAGVSIGGATLLVAAGTSFAWHHAMTSVGQPATVLSLIPGVVGTLAGIATGYALGGRRIVVERRGKGRKVAQAF